MSDFKHRMAEAEEPLELIDDEELVTLLNSIEVRPGAGATDDDMGRLFNWANSVRMENIFLGFLLDGSAAVVGFEGDQPRIAGMEHVLDKEAIAAAEMLLAGGEA